MSTNSWMQAGHAVQRLFLQRPYRNESLANVGVMKRTSVQYTVQNCANNETCFAHYIDGANLFTILCKTALKYVQNTNIICTQIKCAKHHAKTWIKTENIMCNIVQNSTQ